MCGVDFIENSDREDLVNEAALVRYVLQNFSRYYHPFILFVVQRIFTSWCPIPCTLTSSKWSTASRYGMEKSKCIMLNQISRLHSQNILSILLLKYKKFN